MEFVVGTGLPAAEIESLTSAYLIRTAWRMESRWLPELINNQEIVGLEHLQAALEDGKGCLLSFVHHGDYIGAFPSLARAGSPVAAIAHSKLFSSAAPLWMHLHRQAVASVAGSTALDVAGGSAAIRDQLAQGKTVAVALDYPGHTSSRIFGHDLHLSSGGVRIAAELGTPVIPLTSQRIDASTTTRARVVLSPAMRPRDFASPLQLHAALIRRFEESVLEWPEAMEEPLRMIKPHLVRSTQSHPAA